MARSDRTVDVKGHVAAGFEAVRDEFAVNFAQRREIGAACAAYVDGEKVVDLWGGARDRSTGAPWEEDTTILVFSTTKGMAGIAMAVAHARGLYDLDDAVAKHWADFAQNGKKSVTIRQLLAHQAGLCAVDVEFTPELIADHDALGAALARQAPRWTVGEKHGYHAMSLGLYESQLLRRVDPRERSLAQYFADEVADPLELRFWFGLPSDGRAGDRARISAFHPLRMLLHMNTMPAKMVLNFLKPGSVAADTLRNPKLKSPGGFDEEPWVSVEMPSAVGVGEVRSIAAAYGEMATGGARLGLTDATLRELSAPAPAPPAGPADAVFGVKMSYSFGFFRPTADFTFGSGPSSYGTMGAGGSFGFADPKARVGFGYAPNRMGFHLWDDPREAALRHALYRCLG